MTTPRPPQGQLVNRSCNTSRHHPAPFNPAVEASR